jgi:voltage-gated sodium channel
MSKQTKYAAAEDLIDDISGTLSKYGKEEPEVHRDDEDREARAKDNANVEVMAMPFVETLRFNMMIGVVIFVNMICIGLEQDIGYKFTEEDNQNMSPVTRIQKRLTWYVMENLFCVIFLVEMLMRMKLHRWKYFNDSWNCLDFCLVMSALVDTYILSFVGSGGKVRMLTALRVVRMLRLVRFVRMLRMFKELWLIVNGLLNSMKTLGWVGLILCCLLYVFAIFLTNQVGQNDEMYLAKESWDGDEWPHLVYFGSVPRSMLTLFQIMTLDGWSDYIVRHIVHKQPYMAVFFVFFLFLTTYGLMNIIVGVIVENTLGAASMADSRNDRDQEKYRKKILADLHVLFQLSDTDGSGRMDRREFQAACRNPKVLEKLENLGLLLDETDTLFNLLDPTRKGSIDLTEFITTCKQLIGGAKQKDIVQVGLSVETMAKRLDSLDSKFTSIENEVGRLAGMTGDFLRDVLQPIIGFDSTKTNVGTSFT